MVHPFRAWVHQVTMECTDVYIFFEKTPTMVHNFLFHPITVQSIIRHTSSLGVT